MTLLHWSHANWFDAIIIGVVGFSLVVSLFRGFAREAVSLTIWILAIVLGLKFTPPLGDFLLGYMQSETLAYIIAFIALFVMVLLAGLVLGFCLRALIEKAGLGVVDRFLGVCFGIVRGGIVVVILLLFIEMSPMQSSSWYRMAVLPPLFTPAVRWVADYLPSRLKHLTHEVSGRSIRSLMTKG